MKRGRSGGESMGGGGRAPLMGTMAATISRCHQDNEVVAIVPISLARKAARSVLQLMLTLWAYKPTIGRKALHPIGVAEVLRLVLARTMTVQSIPGLSSVPRIKAAGIGHYARSPCRG
jgi:hypothetical protein